jgi:hypothetical protein
MKDAYGDGSAIRGIVWTLVIFYGFLIAIWGVYHLGIWFKS